MKPWPQTLAPLALALECVVLALLERTRPMRPRRETLATHVARNAAIAMLAAIPAVALEAPLARVAMRFTNDRRIGLLARAKLPQPLDAIASVVLLDYSLYLWHRLTHSVPFLWRFHQVHHIDRDLDATTAVRFHFGELTCSVAWRTLAVVAIGPKPPAYDAWQRLLLASIIFHHANVRLPERLERGLSWFVMTPRLHGIHHAESQSLEESNWSSGLSLWDRLHGSFRSLGPEEPTQTGLPAYRTAADVALRAVLALPFRRQRDSWLANDRS